MREMSEYEKERREYQIRLAKWITIGVSILILFIVGLMVGIPLYSVWASELSGKAKLAESEYSKQVQIQEAQSNLEAEKLNAQSEIERAKGAADARKTEGLGMTPEQYIQYLWVKKLSLADSKIIYLPTENGIPALTQDIVKGE